VEDAPVRPDIEAATAQMPSPLGSGREIRKLPEHLRDGETVERMVSGFYGRGSGLLVLTDRRVLILVHGIVAEQIEDFPIEVISSVQWSSGKMTGTIAITAADVKAEVKNIDKGAGKTMVDAVRGRVADHVLTSTDPFSSSSAQGDVFDQIRKLGELHDSGILTGEEFTAKKTELIGRL